MDAKLKSLLWFITAVICMVLADFSGLNCYRLERQGKTDTVEYAFNIFLSIFSLAFLTAYFLKSANNLQNNHCNHKENHNPN